MTGKLESCMRSWNLTDKESSGSVHFVPLVRRPDASQPLLDPSQLSSDSFLQTCAQTRLRTHHQIAHPYCVTSHSSMNEYLWKYRKGLPLKTCSQQPVQHLQQQKKGRALTWLQIDNHILLSKPYWKTIKTCHTRETNTCMPFSSTKSQLWSSLGSKRSFKLRAHSHEMTPTNTLPYSGYIMFGL